MGSASCRYWAVASASGCRGGGGALVLHLHGFTMFYCCRHCHKQVVSYFFGVPLFTTVACGISSFDSNVGIAQDTELTCRLCEFAPSLLRTRPMRCGCALKFYLTVIITIVIVIVMVIVIVIV